MEAMAADLLTGEVIGPYDIVDVIGRRGAATIYRAQRADDQQDVALRVLPLGAEVTAEERTELLRDAETAVHLSHPHLAAVVGTGAQGGLLYAATELVEGQTLGERLAHNGGFSVDDAMVVAQQLLDALRAAHGHGLIHRELGSDMVAAPVGGPVKLLDLGIAGWPGRPLASRVDEVGEALRYRAPEQILGDPIGPEADLYAVGVLLYEMLTGAPPFVADSPASLIYQQLHEIPAAPSSHRPEVSPELDELVLRLLDKEPGRRFGTAREALGALEDLARRLVPRPHSDPEATPGPSAPPFTGREEELEALVSHLQAASDGEGRVVVISGEAGVGKTRLVEELVRVAGTSGARTIRGGCYYGQAAGAYAPFLDALGELLASKGCVLTPEERQRLEEIITSQAPELAHLVGEITSSVELRAGLSVDLGGEDDPEASRQRFFETLLRTSTGVTTAPCNCSSTWPDAPPKSHFCWWLRTARRSWVSIWLPPSPGCWPSSTWVASSTRCPCRA